MQRGREKQIQKKWERTNKRVLIFICVFLLRLHVVYDAYFYCFVGIVGIKYLLLL